MSAPATRPRGDLDGLLSGFLARRRMAAAEPYIAGKRRILDVGCGVFRWEGWLPEGAEYVGIDFAEEVVAHNRAHCPYEFHQADLDESPLDFCGSGFDVIVMLAIVEHLARPAEVLARLAGLLAPDGCILMTTPHPAGDWVLRAGAKVRLFSRDKHQHQTLFDRARVDALVEQSGCKLVAYQRFLFGFNQLVVMRRSERRGRTARR